MARSDTVGVWGGARREMETDGWHLVRTLGGGTKAMREALDTYTPQTEVERKQPLRYQDRLKRSVLFPAYNKAVSRIAALPFQKAPTVSGELPDRLARILGDADRKGTSLAMFAKSIYTDAIDRGVGMFLVDTVPLPPAASLLDADRIDARPYFCRVAPDNLIGFQTASRNGRDVVTELRYREWSYRTDENGIDRAVETVRVWTETDVEVWESISAAQVEINREMAAAKSSGSGYRLVSVAPHGFQGIPLVTCYTNQVGTLQARPALIDLAWLNVAHWNSSSTQGDALHFCRAPVFSLTNASSENAEKPPQLGAGATFVDTGEAKLEFVEISGSSLTAGAMEVATLRELMDSLGMSPLMSAGGPATATGEVRADLAEKSEAQSWVEALEWAIYQGFEFAAEWDNEALPDDFDVALFKDSSLIAGRAQDLPVLQAMLAAQVISRATFLREVKARGVLVTVDDVDEELLAVDTEKESGQQRQMDMLAAQMVAGRQPPADGATEDPDGDPEQSNDDENDPADVEQDSAA